MKYLIFAACLAMIALGNYVAMNSAPHAAKYYAVEKQTAVRPERFEAMKFQGVDVRTPASTH